VGQPGKKSEEAEFEKLLAKALDRDLQRIRGETAARESRKCFSSEGLEKATAKETRYEDQW
jgi:hypothetical protein